MDILLAKGTGTKRYSSWGRYPKAQHRDVKQVFWRDEFPDLKQIEGAILPFGYGRSYGDSCLNNGGVLLDTTGLRQMIAFDTETGLLRCEAGVTLADILEVVVPHGWFLPVTPGSKYVSIAGAIANDVHGKNHHAAGTFGGHVTQFELLRSDGSRMICSPTENSNYFRATIGGLGLTGVIVWAEIQLKAIPTPYVQQENIRFGHVDEFFDISADSDEKGFQYTVSWVDCSATGSALGRGHFTRANFYDPPLGNPKEKASIPAIPIPVDFPTFLVNKWTILAFNNLYYYRQPVRTVRRIVHYSPFFYPLDVLKDWYRGYGKRGFLQYQFVIPYQDREPIKEILRRIAASGQASPLVVFKTFGEIESPGMLSFPRPGVTLALDFAFQGQRTLDLLTDLDSIVFANDGAIYPAKDARMTPEGFRKSFPAWESFAQYVDPKFSSSFWRRVTEESV